MVFRFLGMDQLYCAPSGFVSFGGPQNGADLNDREEAHIASIWATSDRSKMGRSDGRKNSQNLTVRSIKDLYRRGYDVRACSSMVEQ